VISKYLHGAGVDADGAGPAVLGRSLNALARDDGSRAGDADLAVIQVDMVPAEVEQFAAPGAGVRGETAPSTSALSAPTCAQSSTAAREQTT
jgi:hypothetical protein